MYESGLVMFSSLQPHGLYSLGLSWWLSWKRICPQCGKPVFDPWVGKISWRRERLPTPVFWPEESYGLYNPWGHKELDITELLSLSGLDWCVLSGDSARFGAKPMPGPSEKSRILGQFTHWNNVLATCLVTVVFIQQPGIFFWVPGTPIFKTRRLKSKV